MPVQNIDLGRIYSTGEQIKGLRQQNALAPIQMENAQLQNRLLRQKAGQPQQVDPEDLRRAIDWADTPEKWDHAVDVFVSEGRPEFARYKGQFARRDEIKALLASQAEKDDPKSPLGKLARDFEAGLIDEPTYRAAVTKATTSQPLVSIDNKTDQGLLGLGVKQIEKAQTAVAQGEEFVPRLEMIAGALESGNVETGRFQEISLPLKQLAASLGWYESPNLSQEEAVQSAMAFMIPRMRVPGSGSTSDREMNAFATATAKYSNTTAGNILIARAALQIHNRNKQVLDLQQRYLQDHNSLVGVNRFMDENLGKVFPSPKSQDEYDALPSGTVYQDTDGRYKVKR